MARRPRDRRRRELHVALARYGKEGHRKRGVELRQERLLGLGVQHPCITFRVMGHHTRKNAHRADFVRQVLTRGRSKHVMHSGIVCLQ